MTDHVDVPPEVISLAEERARAKADRDFATADALRDRIAELGYVVTDTSEGFRLAPKPPYEVAPALAAIAAAGPLASEATCVVAVLVDGWPDDVERCIRAVVDNTGPDIVVVALDCGNVDGAGDTVHRLAQGSAGRVIELHVSGTLAQVGWGKAIAALLEASGSEFFAAMDLSTVLDGDALGPILSVFDDPSVVGSGWRGVDVDLDDNWRSFVDAESGEVDAVLGYLIVVRRSAALTAGPHPKAVFYRNADMEWSLALRETGGRLVVPVGPLPVHQERHHGYHDSEPEYRDRESRRTFDRLLQRFRGRTDLLRPRG